MITKMKKLTFLVYYKEYEAFLNGVRDLGVVHVAEKQKGVADNTELQDSIRLSARLQATEKLLQAFKPARPAVEETPALPELNLKTNDLGLTDDQMAILRALKAGALQVDDLIEKTQIPTRRVLSALTMMELEDYVEQSGGKHFSLTVTLLEE